MERKYPTLPEIADAIRTTLDDGPLSMDDLTLAVTVATSSEHAIPRDYVRAGIQRVRRSRKPGDPALIVDTMTWRYELTSDAAKVKDWLQSREGDSESRVRTMLAQAEAAMEFTSGRTVEGKRARAEHMHLTRLVQDLEALAEAVA